MRAVHQRRRAQRVEALLDDGGPDVLAAWVVAIVDREQRLEGGHRGGRQRSLREVADARDERRRQVSRDLGADVAIGMLEEDGGPIALEQDHRVVDQAGQDPVEIEPASDVGGDATERLRPMEKVRDLVGSLGAADHRAERVRGDPGDLEVTWPERPDGLADDVEDAPRLARTGDRDGQLGPAIGEDSERIARPAVEQDPGHRRATGPVAAGGELQRLAEDPEPTGQVDESGGVAALGARARPRGEALAAGLPDGHEMVTVGVAQGVDGGSERLVGVLVDVDQPGQGRGDPEVEAMPLGIERVRDRLFELATAGGCEPGGRSRVDAAPAAPRSACGGGRALRRAGLGCGQEALEVTESVAAVASRVDPVVAQPAGVAPGTDRVRVHAKEPGGLGDR